MKKINEEEKIYANKEETEVENYIDYVDGENESARTLGIHNKNNIIYLNGKIEGQETLNESLLEKIEENEENIDDLDKKIDDIISAQGEEDKVFPSINNINTHDVDIVDSKEALMFFSKVEGNNFIIDDLDLTKITYKESNMTGFISEDIEKIEFEFRSIGRGNTIGKTRQAIFTLLVNGVAVAVKNVDYIVKSAIDNTDKIIKVDFEKQYFVDGDIIQLSYEFKPVGSTDKEYIDMGEFYISFLTKTGYRYTSIAFNNDVDNKEIASFGGKTTAESILGNEAQNITTANKVDEFLNSLKITGIGETTAKLLFYRELIGDKLFQDINVGEHQVLWDGVMAIKPSIENNTYGLLNPTKETDLMSEKFMPFGIYMEHELITEHLIMEWDTGINKMTGYIESASITPNDNLLEAYISIIPLDKSIKGTRNFTISFKGESLDIGNDYNKSLHNIVAQVLPDGNLKILQINTQTIPDIENTKEIKFILDEENIPEGDVKVVLLQYPTNSNGGNYKIPFTTTETPLWETLLTYGIQDYAIKVDGNETILADNLGNTFNVSSAKKIVDISTILDVEYKIPDNSKISIYTKQVEGGTYYESHILDFTWLVNNITDGASKGLTISEGAMRIQKINNTTIKFIKDGGQFSPNTHFIVIN